MESDICSAVTFGLGRQEACLALPSIYFLSFSLYGLHGHGQEVRVECIKINSMEEYVRVYCIHIRLTASFITHCLLDQKDNGISLIHFLMISLTALTGFCNDYPLFCDYSLIIG